MHRYSTAMNAAATGRTARSIASYAAALATALLCACGGGSSWKSNSALTGTGYTNKPGSAVAADRGVDNVRRTASEAPASASAEGTTSTARSDAARAATAPAAATAAAPVAPAAGPGGADASSEMPRYGEDHGFGDDASSTSEQADVSDAHSEASGARSAQSEASGARSAQSEASGAHSDASNAYSGSSGVQSGSSGAHADASSVQPIPAGGLAAGAAPERAGDSTQGVAGIVDGDVGATQHESNRADAAAHSTTGEQSAAGHNVANAQSAHTPDAGAGSGTISETTADTVSGADPTQSHAAAHDAARSVADAATESTLAAADAASTANHAAGVDGASFAGGTASGTSATGAQSGAQLPGEQPAPQPELIAGVVEAPGRQATRREEVIPQTLGGLLPLTLGIDGQGEFDFDKAVLRDEVRAQLDVVAERLKSAEYDRLEIVGHTDRIGAEDYNQYLSERRAWAVARYLVEHGVPASKIRVEGRGMHEPMTPLDACADDLGREQLIACLQKDRRVVISASIRKVDVKVQ